MSESGAPSLLDALASHKYGLGKNISIVRSSSAIVSMAASVLLVWVLFRSRDRINTTYHRLLLGLSISDIIFSFSLATFGAVVPNELSYIVWNARGSCASCDAFGFLNNLGAFSGLLYMCSLNLYYLSKVKFNKTDYYVAKKLEPWFHGVPTLFGLIFSIVILAKQGMNASMTGSCNAQVTHDPPHCIGHEDGDVPEGFEIPCGRGKSSTLFKGIVGLITFFLVPIIVGCSLWMIYRSVSRAEQVIARYGAGALHSNHSQAPTNNAATTDAEGGGNGGRGVFSILSAVKRRFAGRASRRNSNNQNSSQSRTVLYRAVAYSIAYCVTWMWTIIWAILNLIGVPTAKLPLPKWQIAYFYVWVFLTPLQGLWTFLIYMQPCVAKRKRLSERNISWIKAFADALWLAVNGGNPPGRRRRGAPASPTAPRTAATPNSPGTNASPPPGIGGGVHAAIAGLALDLPAPPYPGPVQSSRTQEETLAVLRAMNANIVRLTAALEGREQGSPQRVARSAPLVTFCPEGEDENADIVLHPHGGGQHNNTAAPGTNTNPPPATALGAEGPRESSLSSYHSAMEMGSSYINARETIVRLTAALEEREHNNAAALGTKANPPPVVGPGAEGPRESGLSSYHSARETGSSYFSTRETQSSYFSTRETLSSYFSTRETASSYYSASETKSDPDDKL